MWLSTCYREKLSRHHNNFSECARLPVHHQNFTEILLHIPIPHKCTFYTFTSARHGADKMLTPHNCHTHFSRKIIKGYMTWRHKFLWRRFYCWNYFSFWVNEMTHLIKDARKVKFPFDFKVDQKFHKCKYLTNVMTVIKRHCSLMELCIGTFHNFDVGCSHTSYIYLSTSTPHCYITGIRVV